MDSEDFPKIVDSSSLTLHFCTVKDLLSGYSQGRVDTYPIAFQAKCRCVNVNVSRLIDSCTNGA